MQVLIVDDNASMRTLLTALLGGQGYEVVGALDDGNAVLGEDRAHGVDEFRKVGVLGFEVRIRRVLGGVFHLALCLGYRRPDCPDGFTVRHA